MRHTILPRGLAVLLLLVSWSPSAGATPGAFWASFPQAAFPVGAPTTVPLGAGSQVDVTVQTGGTQGVNGADLGLLGIAETGLDYSHLYTLAIFNGGGSGTVQTTLTFGNFQVGAAHERGLLMIGAVNGNSSPITVTSSVPGRVATWTVLGEPFDFGASNSFPIDWNAGSGTFSTAALSGNDSRCVVLDLGDLRTDGTITIALQQHLNDGIVYSIGEKLIGPLDVPADAGARALSFAPPRPNPAREAAVFEFTLPAPATVRVAAFDLAGRRLATLTEGAFEAGAHTLGWDLRDGAGARVPAGLVFVRLETPGGARTRRLLVVP